jgi:[histone H3]-lysine9 N-dimethyltransferase
VVQVVITRTVRRGDQKLERGNLALERSMSRENVIWVVRGYKDPSCLTGKVYMYDGLYRIYESWREKNKDWNDLFQVQAAARARTA